MNTDRHTTSSLAPLETLRVSRVALRVRDLPRVLAFYRDVLGLAVIQQDGTGARLGVGTDTLLDLHAAPEARPPAPGSAGLFHTAFLLPSRVDLGRWLLARAPDRRMLDGAADHLVSEAVYLHDPEGNGVEVYADRPRDTWQWTGPAGERPGQRRVQMANRPLDFDGLHRVAADAPGWAGAPDGTRIGHVHLRVGDVGRATAFYTEALGLDVTAGWPDATFLSADGYHHHLAVNSWQSAGAGPRDPDGAGLQDVVFTARRAPVQAESQDPWGTRLRIEPAP